MKDIGKLTDYVGEFDSRLKSVSKIVDKEISDATNNKHSLVNFVRFNLVASTVLMLLLVFVVPLLLLVFSVSHLDVLSWHALKLVYAALISFLMGTVLLCIMVMSTFTPSLTTFRWQATCMKLVESYEKAEDLTLEDLKKGIEIKLEYCKTLRSFCLGGIATISAFAYWEKHLIGDEKSILRRAFTNFASDVSLRVDVAYIILFFILFLLILIAIVPYYHCSQIKTCVDTEAYK